MKALLLLIVLGAIVYFFMNFGDGRVAGPMSPPFSVTYRESHIGLGIVVKIANHSEKTLYGVRVHIVGRSGHSTDAKVADYLKPLEEKEVGWMELSDWKLEVGEEISIYADGYPAPYVTSCAGSQ
jgi:hypothetical protein